MIVRPEFTEEITLHKLAAGDQSSAVCLYDRYSRIAYSLAFRITGDVHSAEAVVVEAFIELARNAMNLAAKRASTILFLIMKTRRLALRRIKDRDLEYCDFLEIETAKYPECIISLATRNACSILSNAFADLTETQRLLLNLAFFDGLSCLEIANYIGATEETVERGIRSALVDISLNFVSDAK